MSEHSYSVRVIRTDYICDECKVGKMGPAGLMLTSNPPWYVHKCPNCNKEINLRNSYPVISYEKVGEVEGI